jgi:Rad3-related DNA helicase
LTPIAAFFYRIRDCQRKTIIHCTDQEAGDVSEDWEELKSLVVSYMRQYVADIAAGKFPVAPRGDCQTPTCAYCTICRYSESRQERKQKQAGDKR